MEKEYPSLLWLGVFPLYTFISFLVLGDNFTKIEPIKIEGREHSFSIGHQNGNVICVTLEHATNLSHFLTFGFSMPRSHTIHMSLFTPSIGYSSSHMEYSSMPPTSFHDII